jgi:alkylation response protein AidB-like acyl-CoA dehydrogenase
MVGPDHSPEPAMTYRAPLDDIRLAIAAVTGGSADAPDADTVNAVLEGAAKFAEEELAPIDRGGDKVGSRLVDGKVVTPPGWEAAYKAFARDGWGALSGPEEFGGQHLPHLMASSAIEIWCGASLAFGLCPLLTQGAVDALNVAASPGLKAKFLPRMISGEWSGTMNLTEPQAGTDLGAIKTKAVPQVDGSYKISGSKIFITYGDHEMAANIIHLVLARLPDAPAQGHLPVPGTQIPGERGRIAGRAQRPARRVSGAQARHPRLAHLRHELWRQGGGDRLPRRRVGARAEPHVRDDEPGAAGCRRAGRRGG